MAMALYETFQQDLKTALKNKNSKVVSVLRMALAALKNRELEKRNKLSKTKDVSELEKLSKLTNEEVMEVLNYQAKQRRESIEGFKKGGREELASKEEEELNIISKYLPEQLPEEGINKEIEKVMEEMNPVGMQDFGKVMGSLMVKLRGRADGNIVGKLLKEKLQ